MLRAQVDLAAARALGEQDASPHSVTSGCFDRRYWAWKLVDFPEATFQRLVFPLARLYRDSHSRYHGQPELLAAVRSGLACAGRLQHANGSFDQALGGEGVEMASDRLARHLHTSFELGERGLAAALDELEQGSLALAESRSAEIVHGGTLPATGSSCQVCRHDNAVNWEADIVSPPEAAERTTRRSQLGSFR